MCSYLHFFSLHKQIVAGNKYFIENGFLGYMALIITSEYVASSIIFWYSDVEIIDDFNLLIFDKMEGNNWLQIKPASPVTNFLNF
jgi:hypothetical protein